MQLKTSEPHQHSIFEYSRILLILHIEMSSYCAATDLCMQRWCLVSSRVLGMQTIDYTNGGHDVECLPELITSAHSIIRHLQMKESKCLCFCFSWAWGAPENWRKKWESKSVSKHCVHIHLDICDKSKIQILTFSAVMKIMRPDGRGQK